MFILIYSALWPEKPRAYSFSRALQAPHSPPLIPRPQPNFSLSIHSERTMGAGNSRQSGGSPKPNETMSALLIVIEEAHKAAFEARWKEELARKEAEEARQQAKEACQKAEAARKETEEALLKLEGFECREKEALDQAKAMEAKAAEAIREKEQLEEKATDAIQNLNHGIQPVVWPTAEELAAAMARADYSEDRLHFAVCGPSGSGKSSLINALRGLKNGQEGSAETNVVECTDALQRYPDPRKRAPYSRIAWYDIPGAGTSKIPGWQYFNSQGLFIFDFVILVYDMVLLHSHIYRHFGMLELTWLLSVAVHSDRCRHPREL